MSASEDPLVEAEAKVKPVPIRESLEEKTLRILKTSRDRLQGRGMPENDVEVDELISELGVEASKRKCMVQITINDDGTVGVFSDHTPALKSIKLQLDILTQHVETIIKQQGNISMKLSELSAALTAAGDKLEKAKAEILAELEKLKASDPDLSPEGQAAVDRIVAIGEALDAVIPDA